jgi:hypothetical protein
MANRTVSVGLKLESGQFKAEADITKEKVEGLDRTVEKLDRDITKIPADAAKAGAAMKLLGGDADGVGKKLNDLGPAATNSLELIDKKLVETRAEVKKFADEFNRTGSATSFDLWKSTEKDLGSLERIKKDLTGALGVAAVAGGKAVADGIQTGGKEGFKGLAASLQGVLSTPVLGPITTGVVIAAAVAAAPMVGAAINSALIAGLGLGGIGLGIAGAIQSPQVKAAGAQLGTDLKADLANVGAGFVGPLTVALRSLDNFSVGASSKLGAALSPLVSMIVPLERGMEGFVSKIGPGLRDGFARAQPLISLLAADLPQVGRYFSDFIEKISSSAKGNQEGLQFLISTFGQALEMAGNLFQFLSHGFAALVDVIQPVAHVMDSMFGWVPILGGQLDSNRKKIDDIAAAGAGAGLATGAVSGAWKSASIAIDNANRPLGTTIGYYDQLNKDLAAVAANFDKIFGITMGVQESTDGLTKSMQALGDSVKQNGDHFVGNSKAALDNRDAVRQAEQSILAVRDATFAATNSTDLANKAYNDGQAALRAYLTSLHLTSAQIDALIGVYAKVPAKVDTTVNTPGLNSASSGVAGYTGQVGSIPEHINTYVNTPGLGSASVEADLYRGKLYAIPANIRTTIAIGVTGSGAKFVDNGGQVRISGSGQVARRWGGITEHAQEGLLKDAAVYSTAGPARYAFAEPATGGEFFGPKIGNLAKTRAEAQYAVENWWGGHVTWGAQSAPRWAGAQTAAGGGGGAAKLTTVTVNVNAGMGTDGAAVGRQIAQELGRYVEQGGGNVQQVIMRRQVP